MEIRKDILGNTPEVGNTIVFNPPRYKGLVYGECIGFTTVGLPKVKLSDEIPWDYYMKSEMNRRGYYAPRTGFIIAK